MKIAALAGGVGGAKMADGLYRVLTPDSLSVIVNIGDDFEHYGLTICPDLDTVCYTLAGLANPDTGWGLAGDTFIALEAASSLGGPGWFSLGDGDLGTHLERTRRLSAGETLTAITSSFTSHWGIQAEVIPSSDQRVPTLVHTDEGTLPFQEYFVHRQCQPSVTGFTFLGQQDASGSPEAVRAILEADVVVICPSNPWVSIAPILGFQEIRQALEGKIVIAVSPIVGGKALRGPAAKMYHELGWDASAWAVARHYGPLLTGIIIDQQDQNDLKNIDQSGIISMATDTIMRTREDRARLAAEVLQFVGQLDRRVSGG